MIGGCRFDRVINGSGQIHNGRERCSAYFLSLREKNFHSGMCAACCRAACPLQRKRTVSTAFSGAGDF